MIGRPDLYAALGVSPSATPEQIRAAYRRTARDAHPDRSGDPARMAQVNDAAEILLDPVARAEYDLDRQAQEASVSAPPRRPGRLVGFR